MKQLTLTAALAALSFGTLTAQNTFPASGNAGVGITSPNFHLQLHGTTNYIEYDKFGASVNYGVTSRLGFTNTTTGSTANDGLLMRMSGNNFMVQNKESGNISISTSNAILSFLGSSNRICFGNAVNPLPEFGYVNLTASNDNGLYINTLISGKYGLSVRSNALSDNAIQVVGTSGTTQTFTVKASGETSILNTNISPTAGAFIVKNSTNNLFRVNGNGSVNINYSGGSTDKIILVENSSQKLLQLTNDGILRSRRIRVDAENWADFVFEPSYDLMPLTDVRTFVTSNKHLPGVPSEKEVVESGIDIAEMNKILIQKVEELTLYLLQQDEKTEEMKAEISELKAKIIQLEKGEN